MRFLRTNTAVRVTVGPFLDKTDGVTPEVALVPTSEKITFTADTDDGIGPTLLVDATGTGTGGSNDFRHISGDDAGFYDLELSAADTNRLGRLAISINDAATHCPVFHEFMILPAMIYDSLVLGTDRLDANVTHVADTSQTAKDIGAAVPAAAAGASGGLLISGTNSGTTTLGALTVSGATTLAALSCTTLTASGAVAFQSTFAVTTSSSLGALSCTTLTASGAVAFQSTFAVTSTTTLTGAVSLGSTLGVTGTTTLAALTTTGTMTVNAFTCTNAFTVSGATTHTGAFTATHASNNIQVNTTQLNSSTFTVTTGTVDANVVSISGDTTTADNLETTFGNASVSANFKRAYDGTGYGPIMLQTTFAVGTGQQDLILAAGSGDDSCYAGCFALIEDQSTAGQKAIVYISSYAILVSTEKHVTLLAAPLFTVASGDRITIFSKMAPIASDNWSSTYAATRVLTAGTNIQLPSNGLANVTAWTVNITGTLSTVTTVTNQLTAAQIATGVWQDATAGDFTVTSSVGKSVFTGVAPGAAGGHFIAGSNAATTFATLTVTGAVAFGSTFAVTTSSSLGALSCTTLTASGAVAFQSTFAVTTSTSLAALSCTTLTASGAVAFQSTFAVTGTTTLTGAVTASNASNSIVGIRLSATGVDDIWDEVQSGHGTSGTFGKYLDSAISGVSTGGVSAADIADAVWDELRAGHVVSGSFGQGVASVQGSLTGTVATVTTLTGHTPQTGDSFARIGSNGAGLTTLATASALASVATAVTSVGAKTSQLTFTVGGVVDANLQYLNDVELDGAGVSGDAWRPA